MADTEMGARTPSSGAESRDIVQGMATQMDGEPSVVCCGRKCARVAIIVIAISTVLSLVVGGIIGYMIGYNVSAPDSRHHCQSTHCVTNSTTCNDTCDEFTFPEWDYETDTLNASLYGQWEIVIPEDPSPTYGSITGTQFIHAVLLPSGKLLITPGSSLHAVANDLETWPFNEPWPPSHFEFVYKWSDEGLFDIENIEHYYQRYIFLYICFCLT